MPNVCLALPSTYIDPSFRASSTFTSQRNRPPTYKLAPLFGGAITASIPATYTDVSAIRQVPDHQEVWLDSEGFTSIVVEILERVEKPDLEALKFHLEDRVEEDVGEMRVWSTGEVEGEKLPYVILDWKA